MALPVAHRARPVSAVSPRAHRGHRESWHGFQILAEAPGREVVAGSIGRFWQPSIDFATAGPASFTGFDRPGYGKLAWCIRVDPRELRVGATDPESWARFERYWTLIGPFSHGIRRAAMRRLRKSLGPARPEPRRPLAGDRLLTVTRLQKTHEIIIDAPPSRVWPLLMQIGAGRSADRIIPELRNLELRGVVPTLTSSPGGFTVLALEPGKLLVLGDPSLMPGARARRTHRRGRPRGPSCSSPLAVMQRA